MRILIQQPRQLLHLPFTLLAQLFIHISENIPQRRPLLPLRLRKSLQHILPNLTPRLLFHLLIPYALPLHPFPQPGNGIISALPVLDLDFSPVGEAVVAGAVVRDAVAHRFDEDGLAAVFQRHASRFLGDFADGEDVVAVHADRIDAVSDAAARDAVAAVLFQCGGRDGVAVVAADEDDGAGARCGYVEGGVEIAFAGGSFAKVAGYDSGRDIGVL